MPLSAAFTVEGNPNPDEHVVAYGATVDLAVASLAYNTITWSIVGTSYSGQSAPTITLGGTPNGSTASFVMPADPLDSQGRSFRVKCRVTDALGNEAVEYGIVGALNVALRLPVPVGEEGGERNATHGYTDVINAALAAVAGPDGILSIHDGILEVTNPYTRISAGEDTRLLDTILPADVTAPLDTPTTVYSRDIPEDSSVLISVVVLVLNAVDDEDNTTQEFKARYDNIGGTVTERIVQSAGDFDGDTSYLSSVIASDNVSIVYDGPAGDLFPTVQVVGTPPGAWS